MSDLADVLVDLGRAYDAMGRNLDAMISEPGLSPADRDARRLAWVIVRGTIDPAIAKLIDVASTIEKHAEVLVAAQAFAAGEKQ